MKTYFIIFYVFNLWLKNVIYCSILKLSIILNNYPALLLEIQNCDDLNTASMFGFV